MTDKANRLGYLTTSGKWGLILILLMVLSFYASYRVQIAGLLVHPYLVALPIAFLFSKFSIDAIPQRVSIPLLAFLFVFGLSSLQNENPASEIFKVGASIAAFLFFAFAVKSQKDFELMSWGLLICALVIGIQGYLAGERTESAATRLAGINVLEGIGNKNAQSLFTLPGVFFGSFLLIQTVGRKQFFKLAILVISLFFIIISIFLSANRSGWLGLGIIVASVFFVIGFRGRTLFFAIVLLLISYLAIEKFAGDIFERKKSQTVQGYQSDEGRKLLMRESIIVGLENPILGVGLDELHRQMAIRLGLIRHRREQMDTHFLPGYLLGSSGLISTILFFVFLRRLFSKANGVPAADPSVRQARQMVIFFVLLFVVRSFFTREILYSPTFICGLGIVFGHYMYVVRRSYLMFTRV